jgi:hypothetical protein
MKKILAAIIILMAVVEGSFAQTVNWRSFDEGHRNLAHLGFGYDFGVTTQIGYSRALNAFKPILLSLEYSFPMGENLFDDFKVRYGGQMEIIEINDFSVTAKIFGNFRRYQTDKVRIASFGSELSALAGYYRPSWHLAFEFGFDKSVISHLKHSDITKDYFDEINDGWYIPSGGHYFYGIQASKTIGRSFDALLRLGATNAQGRDEDALFPYYFQLGLMKKF